MGKSRFIHHILQNILAHWASADIAVADKKNFYHIL
jgi:hypothetical protein